MIVFVPFACNNQLSKIFTGTLALDKVHVTQRLVSHADQVRPIGSNPPPLIVENRAPTRGRKPKAKPKVNSIVFNPLDEEDKPRRADRTKAGLYPTHLSVPLEYQKGTYPIDDFPFIKDRLMSSKRVVEPLSFLYQGNKGPLPKSKVLGLTYHQIESARGYLLSIVDDPITRSLILKDGRCTLYKAFPVLTKRQYIEALFNGKGLDRSPKYQAFWYSWYGLARSYEDYACLLIEKALSGVPIGDDLNYIKETMFFSLKRMDPRCPEAFVQAVKHLHKYFLIKTKNIVLRTRTMRMA